MTKKISAHAPPFDVIHTIQLDRNGVQPLLDQLYMAIREAILEGRLSPGTRIPASRTMAAALEVSRNTVAAAYDRLVAEGFVIARQGSGSFVAHLSETQVYIPPTEAVSQSGQEGHPGLARRARHTLEIRARAPHSSALPFTPGLPDVDAFPLEKWAQLSSRLWRRATRSMLSYGEAGGYAPLRESIAEYLAACRGVRCSPEQVLILNGAQSGIDLAVRLLLDQGDEVWMEEPGYHGTRGALLNAGAHIRPIPVDEEGIDLAWAANSYGSPRMVCVTPSHQYPSGVMLSLTRRLELLDSARREGFWVLEDDYDSEFRYEGRPLAALQGLDRHDRVMYLGTFSKVLIPALRLGYLVVPVQLIESFQTARSFIDAHPPTILQATLDQFMREGHFSAHIRRMRQSYQRRRNCLWAALAAHLPSWVQIHGGDAGLHLVLGLPSWLDDGQLALRAAKRGLMLRPLSLYFVGNQPRMGVVLGYAGYREDALEEGARLLGELLRTTPVRNGASKASAAD